MYSLREEALEVMVGRLLMIWYSAVYFVGLEDSAFWNFRNQPDEDRCTFFVALSRAKESVTFTFCKRRTGMRYPMQQHNAINEFFDLLQKPGIAEVKTVS